MRRLTFTLLFILIGVFIVNAQLSILPQAGFENTKTSIRYNDLQSFVPLAGQLSPQFSLRIDYKFKHQHGPFLGISSSRSLVNYEFADPDNGMKTFKASAGDMQLRMEGGYQFSSKPIYFKKASTQARSGSPGVAKKATSSRSNHSYQYARARCGSSYNKVQEHAKSSAAAAQALQQQKKGWYMAIQPLIGAAVIPSVQDDVIARTTNNQASYLYNAGNWNSALITGAGFEFGKNVQKKFVVTLQYVKAMGNMNTAEITSISGAKETITRLRSDASGWSVRAGIPIALSKKKKEVKPVVIEQPKQTQNKCAEYKAKCRRVI